MRCLDSLSPFSRTYTDTLRNTLTRGLGESLARSHESLMNSYTPEAITARMHHPEIGLNSTELYYGCQYQGKKNWLSNRSTLTDLGELFEGVDTKKFFPSNWKDRLLREPHLRPVQLRHLCQRIPTR